MRNSPPPLTYTLELAGTALGWEMARVPRETIRPEKSFVPFARVKVPAPPFVTNPPVTRPVTVRLLTALVMFTDPVVPGPNVIPRSVDAVGPVYSSRPNLEP